MADDDPRPGPLSMSGLRLQHAIWGAPEWRAALAPRRDAVRQLEAAFSARYEAPVIALNAARVALRIALECFAQRAPQRDLVLIPAYICPAVPQAVRAAGLRCHFVAVGAELNLDPDALARGLARFGGQVLAVIAAHMYACPADLAAIAALCRTSGAFLVDDAAHAPLVSTPTGQLGAQGHVGIASFAQSKTLVTGVRGSGGLLIINDPDLAPEVFRLTARLSPARGRLRALAHFAAHYLGGQRVSAAAYLASRLLPAAKSNTPQDFYAPARMSERDASIALAQLPRLPAIVAQRSERIEWYARELRGIDGVRLPQYAPGRYLSRLMVRTLDPEFGKKLRRHDIPSRAGYSDVAGALLELPLSVTMRTSEVARVCQSVRAVMNRA